MLKTIWARVGNRKRLYLVDGACAFILPVKQYLDHLAALEKSPHTLEHYCRHLCHYFTFLEQSQLDWRSVTPDDLVGFVQWLRNPLRQVGTYPIHAVSPLSERSVNTIVTAVSSFYRYLCWLLWSSVQKNSLLSLFGDDHDAFHMPFFRTDVRSSHNRVPP